MAGLRMKLDKGTKINYERQKRVAKGQLSLFPTAAEVVTEKEIFYTCLIFPEETGV